MEVPINLPFQKPPAEKPNPKQGIGKLCFLYLLNASNYALPCCIIQWSLKCS